MLRHVTCIATMIALAGPVTAQTLDSKAARKQIFSERGVSVSVTAPADWPASYGKALEGQAKQFPYYSAIAVSTGDPLDQAVAMTATGHHSVAAAQAAAIQGCNAQKKSSTPCTVVATVTPRGFKARSLTLSVEATKALKKDYRSLKAPKALAISAQTGAFAFARGDGARAMAACNAKAEPKGASDCKIVIADQ